MIRGLFISESGDIQIIGNNVSLEKIVHIFPDLYKQLQAAYAEEVQREIERLQGKLKVDDGSKE